MLAKIINSVKFLFLQRSEKELYAAIHEILGVWPRNIKYYKVALMHKSLGHRDINPKTKRLGRRVSNERLEFLGDAILDAVVGDLVFRRYKGKPEGFLTNTRSKLVQRETLGRLAQQMGLTKLIMASGRSIQHNSYMGGNAFEALVGALYLDRGYDACMTFWNKRVMGTYLNADKIAYKEKNFKSKLLEWSQKNRVQLEYQMISQTQDENGSPVFEYAVVLNGVVCSDGEGYSKKEAQQNASEKTLNMLRSDKSFVEKILVVVSEQAEQVETKNDSEKPNVENTYVVSAVEQAVDELSLDDVTAKELSREDIIAAAEAAAYAEK
jgi:ribonuclease-3